MLTSEEKKYAERCRIIVSRKFNIPPDNIDIISILKCIKRGIRYTVKNKEDDILIRAVGEKEKKIVHSDIGFDIIDMIIAGEYPFDKWASDIISKYKKVNSYL